MTAVPTQPTQPTEPTDVREILPPETALAYAAMHELRPHVGEQASFVALVDDVLRPQGYRLLGSFVGGEREAAAVAGFGTGENLPWRKYLYVYDLVTKASHRSKGHGSTLLGALRDEAARQGCEYLHLDSGTRRLDAHRFYRRAGLAVGALHFEAELDVLHDPAGDHDGDPHSDPAIDEITRLIEVIAEAVRDRDLDTLEELIGPEFVLTTGRPGAEMRTRAEWLAIAQDRYVVSSFRFETIDVQPYGAVAVVRSRYHQQGQMDDEDRSGSYLMTDVWADKLARWQLVCRHLTPLVTPPAAQPVADERGRADR